MSQPAWMKEFKAVTAKTYKEQAVFFLNAYWAEHNEEAEKLWQNVELMCELDEKNGKEGSDLDELKAHIFLEKQGGTMTVLELRNKLRAMDVDFNKRMAMVEFLLFKYDEDVQELLRRPQGASEALAKATRALQAAQAEIARIESEKKRLTADSKKAGVRGSMAKNELSQLLSGDMTDLNRSVLTAEAAIRAARKLGGDDAMGALWWVERELEEVRKYKPQSKGGISRK